MLKENYLDLRRSDAREAPAFDGVMAAAYRRHHRSGRAISGLKFALACALVALCAGAATVVIRPDSEPSSVETVVPAAGTVAPNSTVILSEPYECALPDEVEVVADAPEPSVRRVSDPPASAVASNSNASRRKNIRPSRGTRGRSVATPDSCAEC